MCSTTHQRTVTAERTALRALRAGIAETIAADLARVDALLKVLDQFDGDADLEPAEDDEDSHDAEAADDNGIGDHLGLAEQMHRAGRLRCGLRAIDGGRA